MAPGKFFLTSRSKSDDEPVRTFLTLDNNDACNAVVDAAAGARVRGCAGVWNASLPLLIATAARSTVAAAFIIVTLCNKVGYCRGTHSNRVASLFDSPSLSPSPGTNPTFGVSLMLNTYVAAE
jgi:hypothetical protein